MKPTICLFLLVWLLGSAFAAEPASVLFGGTKYELAYVNIAQDGSVTNEYIPQGETLGTWTSMLAVRHWPKARMIGDAASPWMKMIQPLLTQKPEAYKNAAAKSENDIIIEAWLAAPDRSYIEINLHRFVIEAGTEGVKAYQFAHKVVMTGGQGDPTSFMKQRETLLAELGKLGLALHKTKE